MNSAEGNMDIIFVRSWSGQLVPINKCTIVTVDPNTGKVTQEIPLVNCIRDLMHNNMNNFEKLKETWQFLDNYEMLTKI